MIDKDLDKILSDIEASSDFESAREESIREKQRLARKGDINLDLTPEGVSGDDAFKQRIERIDISDETRMFGKGVLVALQEHERMTKQFRKAITESDATKALDQLLRKYNYTFIRSIENIEKLVQDYSVPLGLDTLRKKARKDYSAFFEGFEEENRIDFLVIKEIFLRLREYNSRVRHEWQELSKAVAVLNLNTEGKPLFQALNSISQAAQLFCKRTDDFVTYLARILSIPEDNMDVIEKEIANKIIYHDSFVYEYGALFSMKQQRSRPAASLDEFLRPAGDADGLPAASGVAPLESESKAPGNDSSPRFENISRAGGQPRQQAGQSPGGSTVAFSVRGTRPWNTKEPYLMHVDGGKLDRDIEDLSKSFFFMDREYKDDTVQGEIKRGMLKFITDSSQNILRQYGEFILKFITLKTHGAGEYFSFTGDDLNLFIYHLGPLTVNRMLTAEFAATKTGYCYKYLDASKVTRFLPGEYLKARILEWFENNINPLGIPFDSINKYEDIRRIVSKKYYSEVDAANFRLNEMVLKLRLGDDPRFNRDEYFKSKWHEWFGITNMAIYNRFVDKTIFK